MPLFVNFIDCIRRCYSDLESPPSNALSLRLVPENDSGPRAHPYFYPSIPDALDSSLLYPPAPSYHTYTFYSQSFSTPISITCMHCPMLFLHIPYTPHSLLKYSFSPSQPAPIYTLPPSRPPGAYTLVRPLPLPSHTLLRATGRAISHSLAPTTSITPTHARTHALYRLARPVHIRSWCTRQTCVGGTWEKKESNRRGAGLESCHFFFFTEYWPSALDSERDRKFSLQSELDVFICFICSLALWGFFSLSPGVYMDSDLNSLTSRICT